MEINTGDTAWVLASSALVLLMTPGVAFFYGGMVRVKSVLNMLMMSFAALAVGSIVWAMWGYSLAFGDDAGGGLVGNLGHFGLASTAGASNGLPTLAFVSFQMMFAVITAALISGAIADRAKFGAWVAFVVLWLTLVYSPVAHWVWQSGGWIFKLGALDFAGGTVVHMNAGAAGLAVALVLGKRRGWPKEPMRPHNLPLVVLGAALLWFGWFGFNAGSALGAGETAAHAFLTTQLATAAAVLGWLLVERLRDGHATTLGAASGAVAGLVAITPACAAVSPLGAIVLGVLAGVVCAYAVGLKYRLGYDDSLDVVGVHLVGGLLGALLIGFLADAAATGGPKGLLYGGGLTLLGKQALAAAAVLAYSFVASYLLARLVDKVIGFRVSADDELTGIDATVHAESAYELGTVVGGAAARRSAFATSATTTTPAGGERVEA